jgi:hypothetical protein
MSEEVNQSTLNPYFAKCVSKIKDIHLPTEVRKYELNALNDEASLLFLASSWHDFAERAAEKYVKLRLDKPGTQNEQETPFQSRCRVLGELARVGLPTLVRCAAVEKLSDPVLLADLAENDADWKVRRAAVQSRLLNNQVILAEVARTDPNVSVRRSATNRLTDQVVLAELAKAESDIDFMLTIATRLADPDAKDSVLAALLTGTSAYDALQAAKLMSAKGLSAAGFKIWSCPECGGAGSVHIEYGWDADCSACSKQPVRLVRVS